MNWDKRRIAFYGGSFDPFHSGHLEMARTAMQELRLDQVFFVPARINPLKEDGPVASPEARVQMIRLGIAGEPKFGIWEGELSREGPSYTLHSVEHIERVFPNSHLFWIIGSDQLENLKDWHQIERLVLKIGFILVKRPGYELTWPGVPGLHLYPLNNPLSPVSASEIREKISQSQPISGLVPSEIENFITENALYR